MDECEPNHGNGGATPEDIRVEYQALNQYGTTVVSFRFTLLGFYLAATGFLIGAGATDVPAQRALLLLAISLSIWVLELRNRSLIATLSKRSMQIETDEWKYVGSKKTDPFVNRQWCAPRDRVALPFVPRLTVAWPSHTLGFDLVYASVSLFAIYEIFA